MGTEGRLRTSEATLTVLRPVLLVLRGLAISAWHMCRFRKRKAEIPPRLHKQQLRALANYFRIFHGNKSFVDALAEARSLSENGALKSPVWNQIAEEIAAMEASPARPAVASSISSALLAFRRRRSLLFDRYPPIRIDKGFSA